MPWGLVPLLCITRAYEYEYSPAWRCRSLPCCPRGTLWEHHAAQGTLLDHGVVQPHWLEDSVPWACILHNRSSSHAAGIRHWCTAWCAPAIGFWITVVVYDGGIGHQGWNRYMSCGDSSSAARFIVHSRFGRVGMEVDPAGLFARVQLACGPSWLADAPSCCMSVPVQFAHPMKHPCENLPVKVSMRLKNPTEGTSRAPETRLSIHATTLPHVAPCYRISAVAVATFPM